jgi:hypothetical protein
VTSSRASRCGTGCIVNFPTVKAIFDRKLAAPPVSGSDTPSPGVTPYAARAHIDSLALLIAHFAFESPKLADGALGFAKSFGDPEKALASKTSVYAESVPNTDNYRYEYVPYGMGDAVLAQVGEPMSGG